MNPRPPVRLTPHPLAGWERGDLLAALKKAGLPVDDLPEPGRLFWRFESNDVPVGFGGLEIHHDHALLRTVVTLPPVRNRGVGRAIVSALESEARLHDCRKMWALTATHAAVFERLGYRQCRREEVPDVIRGTQQFARLCPADAQVMLKHL
jgi:N-acetylglutamate synthase-like GNAT family acetyltransferase